MDEPPKIVVIGAGPSGLGAAVRLTELKHSNWHLYDCGAAPGGLSCSFYDKNGFTWDLGGHVIFSHYQYFDDVMDLAVADWNQLRRESWVRLCECWVPYPLQNNIHRLPDEVRSRCLAGLEAAAAARRQEQQHINNDERAESTSEASYSSMQQEKIVAAPHHAFSNFEEMFVAQLGEGISTLFMRPYNLKVWAVPLCLMGTDWVAERVPSVDVDRVKQSIRLGRDDLGWGPNATFRFPQKNGTGGIYQSVLDTLLPRGHCSLGDQHRIIAIDVTRKQLTFASGDSVEYDALVSTMPLDELLRLIADGLTKALCCVRNGQGGSEHSSSGEDPPLTPRRLREIADQLVFSSTHVIGLGIQGSPPAHLKTACWMYFPEDNTPFYRATVFSNYAASNAPAGCWSLMLEVSENARFKQVNARTVVEDCVRGCLAASLLTPEDTIVSRWHHVQSKGYPVPMNGRDACLHEVLPVLRDVFGIYSRGRLGAWKYEVSNQDHSMMQGVEAVNHYLCTVGQRIVLEEGHSGNEETLNCPDRVNGKRGTARCRLLGK